MTATLEGIEAEMLLATFVILSGTKDKTILVAFSSGCLD